MNENTSMGMGGYVLPLFIILIVWLFMGGGCGFGGFGWNRGGCGTGCAGVSNCDVEKQNIITAAETNYRVIDENRRSTDMISAQLRAQWDANQGEKIFDLKMNSLAQQNAYNLALSEKNATIERMTLANAFNERFNAIGQALNDIKCSMLRKPDVTGVGAVCPNAGIINGLGINSLAQFGCGGCGYNC